MKFNNPDEQYVFDERIAILTDGPRAPTENEVAMAIADVWRFRSELVAQTSMKEQPELALLL